MLGKVKKWLGIEGVKLELLLPEEVSASGGSGRIEGSIRLYSMNRQTVTSIKVVLIEKYTRGRGKERLIDEYELGSRYLERQIEIPDNEEVEVNFSLSFSLIRSDVDDFARKNPLFGGLASLARMAHGVKSEYRIEAEARVKGTALNPFDKKAILIK